MVTKEQLKEFLSTFVSTEIPKMDVWVSIILENTEKRPLPNIELIQKSEQMRSCFVEIFDNFKNRIRLQNERLEEYKEKESFIQPIIELKQLPPEKINDELQKHLDESKIRWSFSDKIAIKRYINGQVDQENLKKILTRTPRGKLETLYDIKEDEELFRIAFHNKQTELAKLSLELHSLQYQIDMEAQQGPVHIIHFYENSKDKDYEGSPRASEYLSRYNSEDEADDSVSFNQTSHGIGSGVYGLGLLNPRVIEEQIDGRGANFEIFTISNPWRLSDNKTDDISESEYLSSFSKQLQVYADLIKSIQHLGRKMQTLKLKEPEESTLKEISINRLQSSPEFINLLKKSFKPEIDKTLQSTAEFKDKVKALCTSKEPITENEAIDKIQASSEYKDSYEKAICEYQEKTIQKLQSSDTFNKILTRLISEHKLTRKEAFQQIESLPTFINWIEKASNDLSLFKSLNEHFSKTDIEDKIRSSLLNFIVESKKAPHFHMIAMPINYFIKELGYNGVVSSVRNSFNQGLIAIDAARTNEKTLQHIPVKMSQKPRTIDPMTHILPVVEPGTFTFFAKIHSSPQDTDPDPSATHKRTGDALESSAPPKKPHP